MNVTIINRLHCKCYNEILVVFMAYFSFCA